MQIFSNNGATTLAVAVNALDTTITVVDASKFPVGEFKVTLETVDRSKNEIVLVTGVVGNVLTVVRAQEGTVATDFPVDAKVENRVTAEWLNALQTTVDGMVDDATTSTIKTWSSSKIDTDKQNTLVSGTNIKTINGTSLLGSGNITTPTTTVNNTLTSTSTTEALSAAQGKVLQDSKAALSHTHTLSQITDFPSAVSATELGYLDGVTSSIQTQLNNKEPTITTLPISKGGTGTTTSTGTGSVVLSNSPTLTTPNIGAATGTSFNSITGLSSIAPSANGTAAVGTSTTAARSDHVHPLQTTITGNAGTATTLQTARTIQTNLASTTAASFNGSANITTGVTGTLPVENGGTGATTLTGILKGNGTGAIGAAVSGTDIKTINGASVLGSGDITTPTTTINNTLTSTSTTQALSAAMGKQLQDNKQATLVSGTNIKTINNESVLGSGDIKVQPTLVSGTNIKTINGTSLLGSGNISLSSINPFPGMVGEAGTQGFGVSDCPSSAWLTELGLSPMVGTSDKASGNYGNYQHTNGGVSVFIPKFYYKFGDAADPAFGTYGANTLTIKGIETFSGEAAANVAGYALHRAFIDNGIEQPGFFIDKYLASKDGTSSCKSVKDGVPISLTTTTTYTNSKDMTGCTGIVADSVVLSRARGTGWNCESIFQADALAKLSLAHAQHATSTTYCAWYDATGTTSYPKGCNTALKDTNDATVTFVSAGDSGDANKPKTGSASNLAKTTHNGQLCGVTDINGAMYQALIGLTMAGTSVTDTAQNTTGNAYVLKRTAAHRALTGGFGGANDAWGTTSSLTTNFDAITGFEPWTSTTAWVYFGNGATQVFSGETSGTDYLRSCCGIGALAGMSASGTNQYGNDGCYQYGRANQVPLASGHSGITLAAGAFSRSWYYVRSSDNNSVGFRCSAYGS